MEQRSSIYSETGMTILEPGRGQLHAEPHIQNFLQRHISTVAKTRIRTEQAPSDEDLW